MSSKWQYLAFAVLLALAFSAGWWFTPTKTVEKIVTVEKVKYVKDAQRNVDTETRIVKKPDGTTETTIKERDRSTERVTDNRDTRTDSEKTTTRDSDKWLFTALIGAQRNGLSFSLDPSQTAIAVQRSLFMGIYVGPFITANGDFGVAASLRF